jgi:hypothetical protein
MKKKDKPKKKEDMPEFSFKQFTPEEGRVYEEAVNRYREAVGAGKKLKEAFETYAIADDELRAIIQADFLKILIADRHFTGGEPIESLAAALDVPVDLVKNTLARMLQEVGITAANQFGQEIRSVSPDELKTND